MRLLRTEQVKTSFIRVEAKRVSAIYMSVKLWLHNSHTMDLVPLNRDTKADP